MKTNGHVVQIKRHPAHPWSIYKAGGGEIVFADKAEAANCAIDCTQSFGFYESRVVPHKVPEDGEA